jgi:hypothetical protein
MDNGMSTVSLSMASNAISTSAEPGVPRKPLFAIDDLGRNLFIAAILVLMLPAMLLVSVFALLVPCLFRVPICGQILRPADRSPKR